MSRTNHTGRRSRRGPGTPRLTPPGYTTPVASRVPPNDGGTADRAVWSGADVRRTKATLKRHGRRVERRRGKQDASP